MMNAAQLVAAFLQIALGNSPLQAGLRFLPMTAMPLLVAPVAGLAVLGTLSAMAVGTRGRVSTGVPTRPASARPEATMAVALRQ